MKRGIPEPIIDAEEATNASEIDERVDRGSRVQ